MAPPLQAISILHHLLLAASMVVMVSSSAELAEPPSGHRFQLIRLSPTAVPAPIRYFDPKYLMEFRIGNSLVSGIADTGSDLIWTNNSQLIHSPKSCPCVTVKEKPDCCHGLCMFERNYGGGSDVRGFMGKAELTFEKSSYTLDIGSAVVFGCHLSNVEDKACSPYRAGGIVGLGRGKLSLVKQLWLHSFSYCLPDHRNPQLTSLMKLNDSVAALQGMQRTELVVNTDEHPSSSWYYVKLESIEVGGKNQLKSIKVSIPNGCFQKGGRTNGDGGMVIDSGTPFTRLPEDVLLSIREHVNKLMNKEPKKNSKNTKFICYDIEELPKDMPNMVLHFCDGAQMVIPVENYMHKDKKDKEFCLAFKKQELPGYPNMSLLGNYQQQNIRMLFDIKGNYLYFEKHECGQAEEKKHAAV